MAKAATKEKEFTLPALSSGGIIPFKNFWVQAAVIFVIGFGLYLNSIPNEYALDDDIVIRQNRYVMEGFAGVDDILSKDAYASFYESMGVQQQLSGGRYRPLSIVTFAIETQLFAESFVPKPPPPGADSVKIREHNDYQEKVERVAFEKQENINIAPVRHTFQVLYYLVSMVLLLYFLRNHIFRKNTDVAFIAVLLFTAHPIHTEVVANVKSRDEIFSLLFITLTFIFYFRYDVSRKMKDIAWCGVSFFLALLSKEYAVVVPALLVIGVMIFHKRSFGDSAWRVLPVVAVLGLYFIIRVQAIGLNTAPVNLDKQDLLNDPYLNLKRVNGFVKEKGSIAASKIDKLDNYLYLLVWPHPLSADYSYNTFPYSKFKDGSVWLALLLNLGIIALAIRLWLKRHPMAFALAFYLAFFMLINNMVFDIGATMGERLIYHSSLGFTIIVAWLIAEGARWLNARNHPGSTVALVVVLAITAGYGFKTVSRNPDWKSDYELFTRDVKYVPESALANGNAGARYMDKGLEFRNDPKQQDKVKAYADTAIMYLEKSVAIHPKYVNGYLNLGLCYYYKQEYQKSADNWQKANQYFYHHPLLHEYAKYYINKGMVAGSAMKYDSASMYFRWAAQTDPAEANIWQNYGGASFMAARFTEAKNAFNEAFKLDTNNRDVRNGYVSAEGYERLQQQTQQRTNDPAIWLELGKAYMNQPAFFGLAEDALNKAAALKPGDAEIQKAFADLAAKKQAAAAPPAQPPAAPAQK